MRWSTRDSIPVLFVLCAMGCTRTPEGVEPHALDPGPVSAPGRAAPASEVSALPAAQSRADRAAWRALLHWPDDCEEAFETTNASADAGLVVHQLAQGVTVIEVRCAAGAYQPSSLVMRVDSTPLAATLLTFPSYASADGVSLERIDTTELWGETNFDEERQVLTVLSLSRQTGDCGTWTDYTLAGGAPKLVALYARLPCPGTPEAPVDPAPGQPPAGWKRMDVQ